MDFPLISNVVYSIGRNINNNYVPLGTCILLNKPGIFVTAAHVIQGCDKDLCIRINDSYINDYQDTLITSHTVIPAKVKAIDPLRDLCLISVDSQDCSNIQLSNTDVVRPGELVTVFGFPHSDLNRVVLTQQTCEIGAKILLSASGIKSKHVVLNIQSRPGQSGGPIIRNSDASLIGILIGAYVPSITGSISLGGIDPQTLHQTTHAVSTEYIERMLNDV
jgi:S1-C subfamily serine protease